ATFYAPVMAGSYLDILGGILEVGTTSLTTGSILKLERIGQQEPIEVGQAVATMVRFDPAKEQKQPHRLNPVRHGEYTRSIIHPLSKEVEESLEPMLLEPVMPENLNPLGSLFGGEIIEHLTHASIRRARRALNTSSSRPKNVADLNFTAAIV